MGYRDFYLCWAFLSGEKVISEKDLKLLDGAILGPHFIHQETKGFGGYSSGKLPLVIIQDAHPIHYDIVEKPA